MIYLDVDALNERFWNTELTYLNDAEEQVTVPMSQKLDENGEPLEVDRDAPWVRWTINPGASVPDTTGPNPFFKNIGHAVLEVHVSKGMGTGAARDVQESFLAAFRKWSTPELQIYKTAMAKVKDEDFHKVTATVFYQSKRRG